MCVVLHYMLVEDLVPQFGDTKGRISRELQSTLQTQASTVFNAMPGKPDQKTQASERSQGSLAVSVISGLDP